MSAATENLYQARKKYDIATAKYWEQRRSGGIRELDPDDPAESDDIAAGAKFKATTPVARMVIGAWRKAKADLDHWAGYVAWEKGRKDCITCPGPRPMGAASDQRDLEPVPDPRLPRERDEDEAVFP